jgi:hypothetical protein
VDGKEGEHHRKIAHTLTVVSATFSFTCAVLENRLFVGNLDKVF